jgi:hypothetical protein
MVTACLTQPMVYRQKGVPMRSSIHRILIRVGVSVAATAILITGSMTSAAAADAYTPTMKDMRSIQNALEMYLRGFDTHDPKLQAKAFWDDAVMVGPTGEKTPVKQMMGMGGPPPGGPPSGPPGAGAGGPPEGMTGTPPSCDAKAGKPEKGWEMWHIVANSSFEFLSPTRVRHHAYWFAVCPGAGPTNGVGLAVIGPPGHYDDILEKRNGEWRLISRTVALNEKYPKN